jgi:hypothetical protein
MCRRRTQVGELAQLLGLLRRAWRAHIAKQDAIIAGLHAIQMQAADHQQRLDRIGDAVVGLAAAQQQQAGGLLDALHRIGDAGAGMATQIASLAPLLSHPTQIAHEDLVAALLAADGRNADPASLPRHHMQIYSQDGADGIIAEIFRRIGVRDRSFVEIGIGDGTQNNTRFLLEQGWSGVWIEGDAAQAGEAALRFASYVASGHLKIVNRNIEPDNARQILGDAGVPAQFDFLSLDIDHNTTHVWRALGVSPRVACLEYNASVPATVAVEVPYVPGAAWDGTSWFGGSLKTLELIGSAQAMCLVGCDPLGVNAFFVRREEVEGKFLMPFTAEAHYQPPRFRAFTHLGHPPAQEERRWQPPEEAGEGARINASRGGLEKSKRQ